MTDKKTTVDVALTQLGVKEATGKNDGIPAERYMRGDELPWCAAFVLWCNDHSDDEKLAKNAPDYYRMRNVQAFEDEMKARGKFFTDPSLAEANDIVFFQERGKSDPGVGRHMGVVFGSFERFDIGRRIHTIEGNSSNAVTERHYSINTPHITGFARINGLAPAKVVVTSNNKRFVPRIFVAAPYRAKTIHEVDVNIQRARRIGARILACGAYPIIPHSNTAFMDGLIDDEVILEGVRGLMLTCHAAVFTRVGIENLAPGVQKEWEAWPQRTRLFAWLVEGNNTLLSLKDHSGLATGQPGFTQLEEWVRAVIAHGDVLKKEGA